MARGEVDCLGRQGVKSTRLFRLRLVFRDITFLLDSLSTPFRGGLMSTQSERRIPFSLLRKMLRSIHSLQEFPFWLSLQVPFISSIR